MAPSIDRILSRILEETRLARLARHPKARIAHYMLADAYRTAIDRLLGDRQPERRAQPALALPSRCGPSPYRETVERSDQTGFLTDGNA